MLNIRTDSSNLRSLGNFGIAQARFSIQKFTIYLYLSALLLLLGSCGQGGTGSGGRKGTVKATFRYLENSGALKGYLNFYQMTQNDSLIPDPRLYHFDIDGRRVRSGQMDNSYYTYFLVDTINDHEFQLNILPDKAFVKLTLPQTPKLEIDTLCRERPWVIRWNADEYDIEGIPGKERFLITVVVSDTENRTVLKKSDIGNGEIVFAPEELSVLQPGPGYYYVISTLKEHNEVVTSHFKNVLETYSADHPIEIYSDLDIVDRK